MDVLKAHLQNSCTALTQLRGCLFSLFIAPPISGNNENIFSQGHITQVASYLPNDKDASVVYMKPPMFHNSSYLSSCNSVSSSVNYQ
jgi:hypothetical protein